ncbi:MAG: hypothetical protein IJP30_02475 [Clostridia bacterium]|nr:hypothetical protein [Clostridia bacterium]
MKKRGWSAAILAMALVICGCTAQEQTPLPTAPGSSEQTFESYITQTAFSFPGDWEYQSEDGAEEGMTAWFAFNGGRCAVQFIWMNAAQKAQNVFLEQLDMDDVTEQTYQAGAYQGRRLLGRDGMYFIQAFEGERPWYNTELALIMRVVAEYEDENTFDRQSEAFDMLLKSTVVNEDADIPAPDMLKTEVLPFTDFGLAVSAPTAWAYYPEFDMENSSMVVDFEVATGECLVTVEYAGVDKAAYQAMVQSVKSLGENADVYDFHFDQSGQSVWAYCVRQGKIVRIRIEPLRTENGQVRYLWLSSQLRPEIDCAYYETVVEPMWASIETK